MITIVVTNREDDDDIYTFHPECFNRINRTRPNYHLLNEDEYYNEEDDANDDDVCFECKLPIVGKEPNPPVSIEDIAEEFENAVVVNGKLEVDGHVVDNKTHLQFIADIMAGNESESLYDEERMTPRWYHGRGAWEGVAVAVDDIRAIKDYTNIPLRSDVLGYGYIAYPNVTH